VVEDDPVGPHVLRRVRRHQREVQRGHLHVLLVLAVAPVPVVRPRVASARVFHIVQGAVGRDHDPTQRGPHARGATVAVHEDALRGDETARKLGAGEVPRGKGHGGVEVDELEPVAHAHDVQRLDVAVDVPVVVHVRQATGDLRGERVLH